MNTYLWQRLIMYALAVSPFLLVLVLRLAE